MSRLGFIILLLVSSETVFVASQLTCSRSDDCDSSSCCFQKSCSSDQNICEVLKRIEELKSCTSDYQCSGCCINWRCKWKSSYQCKSCYYNFECESGCCKANKCQSSYECSSYSYTTTPPATQRSCLWNSQCDSRCCKYSKCQPSYVCDSYSYTTQKPGGIFVFIFCVFRLLLLKDSLANIRITEKPYVSDFQSFHS